MNYLLNFSVILLVLWAFYKLVLENTSWHLLKRAFLVSTPLLAAIIPMIVVRRIIVPATVTDQPVFPHLPWSGEEIIDAGFQLDWTVVLGSVYFLGVVVMSIRFFKNLYELRVKASDKLDKYDNYTLILRKAVSVPHSFFNKIYVSITEYKSGAIPLVVLEHEKAHLDQRHSWDILWIELWIIALWFNPLVYLLKFSIKLNHEFLADESVLSTGHDARDYQRTLLAFASSSQTRTIANTFNFPIIKKRFTIMNTKHHKKKWHDKKSRHHPPTRHSCHKLR